MLNFAPDFERTDEGLIKFPRDTTLRRQVQPEEVMKHPAKANMYLMLEIIKTFTEPGDHLVDCFGGSGTTGIGALMGRNVTLVEIEDFFHATQKKMRDEVWTDPAFEAPRIHPYFLDRSQWGNLNLVHGDNKLVLPIPCDHMYFSPPYANDLDKSKGGALNEDIQESGDLYVGSMQNLGRMPEFTYRQMMERLYVKVGHSVRAGGTVTITHRDRSRAGKRVLLANSIIKAMVDNGFTLYNWARWDAPGSFQARINEQRGALVINEEDILTFKKLSNG